MGKHKYQQEVFKLLRHLSGQRAIFTVPRIFVELTGDYHSAAMLSQIIYWSEPEGEEPGWFYKSRKDWAEELNLTEKQIRGARERLENLGLILTEIRRVGTSPVVWYAPNAEGLILALDFHLPKRASERSFTGPGGPGTLPWRANLPLHEITHKIPSDFLNPEEKRQAMLAAAREQGLAQELIDMIFGDMTEHL